MVSCTQKAMSDGRCLFSVEILSAWAGSGEGRERQGRVNRCRVTSRQDNLLRFPLTVLTPEQEEEEEQEEVG